MTRSVVLVVSEVGEELPASAASPPSVFRSVTWPVAAARAVLEGRLTAADSVSPAGPSCCLGIPWTAISRRGAPADPGRSPSCSGGLESLQDPEAAEAAPPVWALEARPSTPRGLAAPAVTERA